ncbi:MAG: RNB domain-containing ribonuclease [Saprospiraceae bacterium]|nr:RNB domain-containing ribonuclease [Saprospiraceae bacterium]
MKKHKKTRIKDNKLPAKALQREILKMFRANPKKQLNPKQIAKKLNVDNTRDSVLNALGKLVEEGHLAGLPDYKFKIKRSDIPPVASDGKSVYSGYVDMTRTGDAYVTIDGFDQDVHVSAKYMNTALHGDHVQLRVWTLRGRNRSEGEVVSVLERATEHFLGTLWLYPRYAIVVPDSIYVPVDILVPLEDTKGANEGDKVVVKVVKWTDTPQGIITTVLGAAGSHDIEMKAILINNGFNLDFPDDAMEESEKLPGEIPEEEIARRLDLREVTTFTIDPENAKDFDDALSIRYRENGHCEIGVHIADVSHYVRPGTPLDREAYKDLLRFTS